MAALFPDIGNAAVLLLLAVSFAGSLITASFGLGGGVLVLATLASILPPAALIPVHGMVQLGSNIGRVVLFWRYIHWPVMLPFAAGALLGVALGGVLVVEIPASILPAGVGIFVIWSVVFQPPNWMAGKPGITGVASSFLTMFFGATGPFVAVFVRSLGLDKHGQVALQGAMMTVQHALKLLVFALLGFAFGPWAGLILGMIAMGVLGTLVGKRILGRMSDRVFRQGMNVLLVALGLRLIWIGLKAL